MFNVFCFVALFVASNEASEIVFIHTPDTVHFNGHNQLQQSLLKDVFSVCLGFTTGKSSEWDGISVSNPFRFPEAVVYLEIGGIEKLDELIGHRFPVYNDEDEDEMWHALKRRIRFRFPNQNNTLIRMDLADGLNGIEPYHTALGDVESLPTPTYKALDLNVTEDHEFLSEIGLLQEVIDKVKSGGDRRDGMPDVYWFVLSGLQSIINFHGATSAETQESKQILTKLIDDLKNNFVSSYKGQVLVSVHTKSVGYVRQTRSLKAEEEDDEMKEINISKDYDADYPVIFNILLWFMVAFTFTILAVSVGIAGMDPGRDSIIYRMTSNRMKKDN